MRVLVVSDTHGKHDNLKKAVELVKPQRLIHLGDGEGYDDRILQICDCPLEIVRGNCDSFSDLPYYIVTNIGRHKAFLTHGHRYGVGYSNEDLIFAAQENGADVAMYGHTHVPQIDEAGPVQVINPGSISKPRQTGHKPSYIVIDVDKAGDLHYKLCYLQNNESDSYFW